MTSVSVFQVHQIIMAYQIQKCYFVDIFRPPVFETFQTNNLQFEIISNLKTKH